MCDRTAYHPTDELFMARALQLARNGLGSVAPNPMVGAVIVAPDGRIIGEGFHRRYGGPHAEVNAVASVAEADRKYLSDSTIYVTLEPCAHYGKTPPCSKLLSETGFRRVVVGTRDPFDRVDGKGIEMLRHAGIEVVTGVLEKECQSLNAVFFTAHTRRRPFVTLKWAQSADGFMDAEREDGDCAFRFSDETGRTLVHRLRAHHGAIAVGSGTFLCDSPRLDVRMWSGSNPRKVILDRSGRCGPPTGSLSEILSELYAEGLTSVMVEGGAGVLESFFAEGLWDFARIEVSPQKLGNRGVAKAPVPPVLPFMTGAIRHNSIQYFSNNTLVNRYFVEHGI